LNREPTCTTIVSDIRGVHRRHPGTHELLASSKVSPIALSAAAPIGVHAHGRDTDGRV